MSVAADRLRALIRHPRARHEILVERTRRSLVEYIATFWSVLEPAAHPFVRGWAIDAIAEHLEAIHLGQIKRLLINVPPGMSKSLTTNVGFPTWEWGPRGQPWRRYVSAAYAEQLTIRDNRRGRQIVRSPLYRRLYPWVQIDRDQDAKGLYATTKTGFRLATSVKGVGTGERGHRVIVDDPHSVRDVESDATRETALQWFSEVLPSRLVDPQTSAIIVIMQRVHSKDVSGLILSSELDYTWLCLPMEFERTNRCYTEIRRSDRKPERVRRVWIQGEAIPRWLPEGEPVPEGVTKIGPVRELTAQDPRTEEGELLFAERFPRDYLDGTLKPELRSWGGTYAESGQLQQRPTPRGGGLFQREDFQIVQLRDLPKGLRPARGWDLANSTRKTSPYTASVKMAVRGPGVYVLDVTRERLGPGKMEQHLVTVTRQDGHGVSPSIPQDPGQAGKAQKRHLSGLLQGYRCHFSPETGSKEDRAEPLAAQGENGNLYLLAGPWNDAFIGEAIQFPRGDYSDQIDAASRAYARAIVLARSRSVGAPPKLITGDARGEPY